MRTVLITGTSSGFGLLATVELARRGWRVFASMHNLELNGPLETALEEAGVRANVEIVPLDVNPASVHQRWAPCVGQLPVRLDALTMRVLPPAAPSRTCRTQMSAASWRRTSSACSI
jgi:NAD(P)-dependent dehydrogenase (short-subunit alcohol dehydrogenase family)